MASPPKDPSHAESGGVDPQELQAYFVKSGRYTAGVATHYAPTTVLTAEATHQALAKGFTIGMRLHSAPVTPMPMLFFRLGAKSSPGSVRRPGE